MHNRGLAIVVLLAPLLSGCCGMTSVQSHGGGAGGFASLGAMILGTAAMQRLCNTDESAEPDDAPLPPETDPEAQDSADDSGSGNSS